MRCGFLVGVLGLDELRRSVVVESVVLNFREGLDRLGGTSET